MLLMLLSTLLSQDVLSVPAELKIDLRPASREKRPISAWVVLSFRNASMLMDFFGVSLQMGSSRYRGETFSHLNGPSPSCGFSAKKSKAYFLLVSETCLLSPRLSIASKSLSSVLKLDSTMVCDVYWELLAMSFDKVAYFICYLKLIVSNHSSALLTQYFIKSYQLR